MGDGTETAPAAEESRTPLLEVVKGLRHEPPLLFGIGAGLVLVAILAATTSIAVVAIVAGVLVAALVAWLVRETRTETHRTGRVGTRVRGRKAEIDERADVGHIQAPSAADRLEADVDVKGAKVGKGARVGSIDIGGSRRRRRG